MPSSLTGMKSVTDTRPLSVRKVVSRTLVSGRYCWRVSSAPPAGAILKRPPTFRSRMAANTLGESKRGKQHQSIEPSVPTSAAEDMSPISPYGNIRGEWGRGLRRM